MDKTILNHIKTRRPKYSNNSYFLFNECSNRFISDDEVYIWINNQADVLVKIISNIRFELPIYVMVNQYYFTRASELIQNLN